MFFLYASFAIFLSIISTNTILHADSSANITSEGEYFLSSDHIFDPSNQTSSAFVIDADNVTFNLNGYFIIQTNQKPTVDAIIVNPNRSNVIIKNGTIKNFSGSGIRVKDGNSSITIANTALTNCKTSGIFFDGNTSGTGIKNSLIYNCTITSCTGASGNPAYGLRIVNGNNITVEDTLIVGCDAASTSSGYGVRIESSTGCECSRCKSTLNGGFKESAGFSLLLSNDCLLKECISTQNSGRDTSVSSTSCGFLLDQCNKTLVFKSQSIANNSLSSGTIGFCARSGSRNIFEDCFSQVNTGSSYAAGFELSAETKSYIVKSTSRGNKTITSGIGAGIVLSNACSNCYLKDNALINNSGIAASYGIIDYRSPSTSLIVNNYAFNNGTNFSVTYATGILLPLVSGSLSQPLPGMPTQVGGILDNLSLTP